METETQKDNLVSMGENYAQGFYFYKPMPVERFEALIGDPDNVTEGYKRKTENSATPLRFREMIRKGLVSEPLLDNLLRAAAIFKEEDEDISLIQINNQYAALLGMKPGDAETGRFVDHLDNASLETFRDLLSRANAHALGGSEGVVHYQKSDGSRVTLNMRVFMLYILDNHRLYLSMVG